MDTTNALPSDFTREPPATDREIVECEQHLGMSLPLELASLLRISNGGSGFVGEDYVLRWSVRQIAAYNRSSIVPFIDKFLGIGTDRGCGAYGFDMRVPYHLVSLDLTGLMWDDAMVLGTSFREFFRILAAVRMGQCIALYADK